MYHDSTLDTQNLAEYKTASTERCMELCRKRGDECKAIEVDQDCLLKGIDTATAELVTDSSLTSRVYFKHCGKQYLSLFYLVVHTNASYLLQLMSTRSYSAGSMKSS